MSTVRRLEQIPDASNIRSTDQFVFWQDGRTRRASLADLNLLAGLDAAAIQTAFAAVQASVAPLLADIAAAKSRVFNAADFGLIGDGQSHALSTRYPTLAAAQAVYPHATALTDQIDWCALQQAVNKAQIQSFSSERVAGGFTSPPGRNCVINRPLSFGVPVVGGIPALVYSTMTSGPACIIGDREDGGRNTGYDLTFGGFVQIGGNGDPPALNPVGAIGVEVRSMQDSTLRVGTCRQYTRAGTYLNALNDYLAKQHVQGNKIYLNYHAFNGVGLDCQSADAALAAVQANDIYITNCFSNVYNLQIDAPTRFNTNNNTFSIAGLDAVKGGGSNVRQWGNFNKFIANYVDGVWECHGRNNRVELLYMKGSMFEGSDSVSNDLITYNPLSSDLSWSYGGVGNRRTIGLGAPPTLPANIAIQAGQTKQNTYGCRASYSMTANLVAGQVVTLFRGPSSSFGVETCHWDITGPNSVDVGIMFSVPAGYYWNITVTGTPTISSIRVDADI